MIEEKFKEYNEPPEYYVMPRVRFHPSLTRDDLLDLVKADMGKIRPDCKLNWKQTDLVIFVEILKRNCYLSIFRNFNSRQKYNWQEHHKRTTAPKPELEPVMIKIPEEIKKVEPVTERKLELEPVITKIPEETKTDEPVTEPKPEVITVETEPVTVPELK
jgi:hypothetical protein